MEVRLQPGEDDVLSANQLSSGNISIKTDGKLFNPSLLPFLSLSLSLSVCLQSIISLE